MVVVVADFEVDIVVDIEEDIEPDLGLDNFDTLKTKAVLKKTDQLKIFMIFWTQQY